MSACKKQRIKRNPAAFAARCALALVRHDVTPRKKKLLQHSSSTPQQASHLSFLLPPATMVSFPAASVCAAAAFCAVLSAAGAQTPTPAPGEFSAFVFELTWEWGQEVVTWHQQVGFRGTIQLFRGSFLLVCLFTQHMCPFQLLVTWNPTARALSVCRLWL